MLKPATTRALIIGFMLGIVIFSVAKNTVGLVTLIPLFFIYRLIKTPEEEQRREEAD